MQIVWNAFEKFNVSQKTTEIIMSSWRPTTAKQYDVYIKKWLQFSSSRNIYPLSPVIVEVLLGFMTECFELGLSYSALNSIRAALSTYIVIDKMPPGRILLYAVSWREHLTLDWIYPGTTSVGTLQLYWSTYSRCRLLKKLTLNVLTCKVVTLTALLTALRNQSLHLMDVRNTVCSKDGFIFWFGDKMLQSQPGFHLKELIVKAYAPDRRLCLCTALLEYLSRTSGIRQSNSLFVTVKNT